MERIEYSIPIYIYKNESNTSRYEVKLIFNSMDEKEVYIQKEQASCIYEQNQYMTADGLNRDKFRRLFHEARVKYAKSSGFKPKGNKQTIWVRDESTMYPNTDGPFGGNTAA